MSPALTGTIRHFEGSDALKICDGITFDFYTGLHHICFPCFPHSSLCAQLLDLDSSRSATRALAGDAKKKKAAVPLFKKGREITVVPPLEKEKKKAAMPIFGRKVPLVESVSDEILEESGSLYSSEGSWDSGSDGERDNYLPLDGRVSA